MARSRMSKMDYELFAQVVNEKSRHHKAETIEAVIEIISTAFTRDNSNFRFHTFDEACRTGLHIRSSIKTK